MEWYRKYFSYSNGIQSEATLGRIIAKIDTEQFNNLFVKWVKTIKLIDQNNLVAIDGKRLKGSYNKEENKKAIHMVSAFAADVGVCITQKSCNAKSNEITTIPDVLKQIDKGALLQ